jgi:ferredoxin
MPKKPADISGKDIFTLLSEASKKKKKEKRTQILQSMKIKEFFEEGSISIDKKTCKGVECKLCIKACPTNALYWKSGEVGIEEELCVFCAACVANCIVDSCIRVSRKRPDGEIERFSKSMDVLILLNNINSEKRIDATKLLFSDSEAYLKKYSKAATSSSA